MKRKRQTALRKPKEPVASDNTSVAGSLAWYRENIDNKQKKKWAIAYLSTVGFKESSLKQIPDSYFATIGAFSRMVGRGFVFPYSTHERILNKVLSLVAKFGYAEKKKSNNAKKPDALEKKIGEQYTKFDLIIDNILNGYTGKVRLPSIDPTLSKQALTELRDHYQKELDELKSIIGDSDESEYYSFGKRTRNRLIKLHKDIVQALSDKINSKKRVVRRKTSKLSPARKMKFLKQDSELGLVSLPPDKIVGASKVILYNVKNRNLIFLYAKDESGLIVKGTTIYNYDEEKSGAKILRKPDKQVHKFVSKAKLKVDKEFDAIKATKKKVSGRVNSSMTILSVFK